MGTNRAVDADRDGALLVGRYKLGARLGQGGLGEVRAARDQRLGRSVAVVFLRAIIPPNTWHSFRPDDGASGLRHVAVYDAGTADIEMSTRPGEVFDL